MSASESNDEPFVEDDTAATKFTFDTGGVPIYIGLLWLGFVISLVVFCLVYLVPDLASWLGQ